MAKCICSSSISYIHHGVFLYCYSILVEPYALMVSKPTLSNEYETYCCCRGRKYFDFVYSKNSKWIWIWREFGPKIGSLVILDIIWIKEQSTYNVDQFEEYELEKIRHCSCHP